MANKSLFQSLIGMLIPRTDATNEEGAPAYALSPKHALAQYAATGCLNMTFYATAENQLETVLDLCTKVDGEFVARTAVFSRERAYLKDMPALLTAVLAGLDGKLLATVFPRTIDNGKMLRNFVQIIRSGATGRKSLGTLPKRLVRQWLEARDDESVFEASVGQSPSLADIIKMTHPKPGNDARRALYGYLLGRAHERAALPEKIRDYEAFRSDPTGAVPDVPFQMLTDLPLTTDAWRAIARNAPWHATRMNLNTFARHGAFDGVEGRALTRLVADRLKDRNQIQRSRVFPYQLMVAHSAACETVPGEVREALQDAMETAIDNVPTIKGTVFVCPDVSGSMTAPLTGHRKGATSVIRCVDVAALMAAAIARKNPGTTILPFEHRVVGLRLNPRDSVVTNAAKLASVGGGGTSVSAPLALLNQQRAIGDLVVFISDNESWVDAHGARGTELLRQWSVFRQRNPTARLVLIDLQPNRTTQALDREDILNVGGFSDQVFDLVASFARGEVGGDHWVGEIEKIELARNGQ